MPEKKYFREGFRGARRPQTGVTLVELLVGTASIAVLAALLLPAMRKVREAANQVAARGSLLSIAKAEVQWRTTHASYTNNLVDLVPLGVDPAVATGQWYGFNFGVTLLNAGAFIGHCFPVASREAGEEACNIDQTLLMTCSRDLTRSRVRTSMLQIWSEGANQLGSLTCAAGGSVVPSPKPRRMPAGIGQNKAGHS